MDGILKALAKSSSEISKVVSRNYRYDQAMKGICKLEDLLKVNMGEQAKQHLEQLENLQMEVSSITSNESFINGYRTGALMMIEVFLGQSVQKGGEESDV